MVYDQNPGHVPPRPLGIPYMSLTCDCGENLQTSLLPIRSCFFGVGCF